MNTLHFPHLLCPACYTPLSEEADTLTCPSCGTSYPITMGIPDLRHPRPADTLAEKEVVAQLLAAYKKADYPTLVQLRLRLEPGSQAASDTLMTHITEYVLSQLERGRRMVRMYHEELAQHFTISGHDLALDLGCGSGASLLTLAEQFKVVVGIEPSLASLLLARKALESHDIHNVILVQGYGQHIPYAENSFDYANALNVLEHVFEVKPVLQEIYRTLRPGGCFAADSRNRFDLFLPEPHVQVRWVGMLPRRLAPRYVYWRTGLIYNHTQLLSYGELRQALQSVFGVRHYITFAYPNAYNAPKRFDTWVKKLANIPLLSSLALRIYPSHIAVAQK